jgi:Fibronectin type III domain
VVATISWTPPTAEVNQTAPLDLAGYRIYYGTSEAGMTHIVTVADPTSTSYVVDNLSPGTWYFAVSSYDAAQAESVLSPAVAVTL